MKEGRLGTVRIDFWIAGSIGKWALMRPLIRLWSNIDANKSEECLKFSRADIAGAGDLDGVYDFYRSVWTSIVTGSLAAFGVSALVLKAIYGTSHGNKAIIAVIVVPWFFLMLSSIALIALGFYRGGLSSYQAEVDSKGRGVGSLASSNGGNIDFWISLSFGFSVSLVIVLMLLA